MKRLLMFAIMVMPMLGRGLVSAASANAGDSRSQIEARLKERYPDLRKAEDQGKVGETWQGMVEAVDAKASSDVAVKKLIAEENADRQRLYDVIATEESKRDKITAAMVGERNGLRKFEKAQPDDFLKVKNGQWVQRKDVARLKKDGMIGEAWDGYLSAVNEKDKGDAKVSALLDVENRLRRDVYLKTAHADKTSVNDAAAAAGTRNIAMVATGEWFLPKDGKWTRKS